MVYYRQRLKCLSEHVVYDGTLSSGFLFANIYTIDFDAVVKGIVSNKVLGTGVMCTVYIITLYCRCLTTVMTVMIIDNG